MPNVLARGGTLALVGLAGLGASQPSPAATLFPTGTWQTEDGRARIRTERCGAYTNQLCGFVVWLKAPLDESNRQRIDRHNPDPSKQGRSVLGHQMLLGLLPNPENHYEGKVYSSDNGKSYDLGVWSDQPSELTVRGCMLVFCGTQTWKRVTDVLPGQLQGPTDTADGPRTDPEWAKPAATGSIQLRKAPATGR